jgi:hypothetical protein
MSEQGQTTENGWELVQKRKVTLEEANFLLHYKLITPNDFEAASKRGFYDPQKDTDA